jgi:hypothetical protein
VRTALKYGTYGGVRPGTGRCTGYGRGDVRPYYVRPSLARECASLTGGAASCHRASSRRSGARWRAVDKNTVTQECNQGMRPNTATCGCTSKIKSYISDRANRKKDAIYL